MAGILYVILMILTGRELVNVFLPPEDQSGGRRGSRFLVVLVGAFGVGALTYGWGTYMLSWGSQYPGGRATAFLGKSGYDVFGYRNPCISLQKKIQKESSEIKKRLP